MRGLHLGSLQSRPLNARCYALSRLGSSIAYEELKKPSAYFHLFQWNPPLACVSDQKYRICRCRHALSSFLASRNCSLLLPRWSKPSSDLKTGIVDGGGILYILSLKTNVFASMTLSAGCVATDVFLFSSDCLRSQTADECWSSGTMCSACNFLDESE